MEATQRLPALVDPRGRPLRRSDEVDQFELSLILARERGLLGRHGVHAGRPTAQNVWVYSCVSQIAEALAEMPLRMWESARRQTEHAVMVPADPLLDLLDEPNDLMDRQRFVEAWYAHLGTWGNVWIHKDAPNSRGLPRSLMVWGADIVRPIRPHRYAPPTGWRLQLSLGGTIDVPLEDMIHSALPNPYDPLLGLPPVIAMSASLDADLARTLWDKYFYRNNATPDAILTSDQPLGPDERKAIYEGWREYHEGVENAGGIAVLGGGFDLKVLGVNHSLSQFIDVRRFTREEVAAAYRFPVLLLNAQGNQGGLSKDDLAGAREILYERAVFPQATRFANAISRGLLWTKQPNRWIAFDPSNLPVMSQYLERKAGIHKTFVLSGIPVNASLARLDMGIRPVDGGDVAYLPKSLMAISGESGDPKPAPEPDDPPPDEEPIPAEPEASLDLGDAREYAALTERCRRRMKRVFFDCRTAALKAGTTGPAFDLEATSERWVTQQLPVIAAAIKLGVEQVERALGQRQQTWAERAAADLDAHLDRLQAKVAEIRFPDAELNATLEAHVVRSARVVADLWRELSAPRTAERITTRCAALHPASAIMAERQVRAAVNAGRRWALARYGRTVAVASAHTRCARGEYPGDPALPFTAVCECSVEDGGRVDQLPP